MPNLKNLGLLAALPGLMLAIPAPAAAAQGDASGTCKVSVERDADHAGSLSVQRQQLENGSCICFAYTGPAPQSDKVEADLAALMQSQACPDAPLVAVAAGTAAVGGGIGGAGLGVLGLAAAGGAAAALSSGGDGSNSP